MPVSWMLLTPLTPDFILYICQSHGPPLWAWVSDMLPIDAEQRALTISFAITMYYAINSWSNVLIFPASQAPHYKHGWPVCLALWITCIMVICALRLYDLKVIRPRNHRKLQQTMEDEGVFTDSTRKLDEEEDAIQKYGSGSGGGTHAAEDANVPVLW